MATGCTGDTSPVCITNDQIPIICDPTSPFLNDFCGIVCNSANQKDLCISNCTTKICNFEGITQSLTGYIWALARGLAIYSKNNWSFLPSYISTSIRTGVLGTLILLVLGVWLISIIILTILVFAGIVTTGTYLLSILVTLIIAIIVILGTAYYISVHSLQLETKIKDTIEQVINPNKAEELIKDVVCLPAVAPFIDICPKES